MPDESNKKVLEFKQNSQVQKLATRLESTIYDFVGVLSLSEVLGALEIVKMSVYEAECEEDNP